MQINTLPSMLQWPQQLLLFIGLLLASHLLYTLGADHYWLLMHEFTHPALSEMSAGEKEQLATAHAQKSMLFLFVKGHFWPLMRLLGDLMALVLLSYGLVLLLKLAVSFGQLCSLCLLLLLPATLYQGVVATQILLMHWPIQQEFTALNQLTLNALVLQLPFHHPWYELACQIQLPQLVGIGLVAILAVKYLRLAKGYAVLLAVLPTLILWCSKLLMVV